jgi:hypothetical protein
VSRSALTRVVYVKFSKLVMVTGARFTQVNSIPLFDRD